MVYKKDALHNTNTPIKCLLCITLMQAAAISTTGWFRGDVICSCVGCPCSSVSNDPGSDFLTPELYLLSLSPHLSPSHLFCTLSILSLHVHFFLLSFAFFNILFFTVPSHSFANCFRTTLFRPLRFQTTRIPAIKSSTLKISRYPASNNCRKRITN